MQAELLDPTRGESEPDRFWTLANASEAAPLIMTPLCWTLWRRSSELGTRGSMYDFGILPRREIRLPADPNEFVSSCFYGRLAMNVDRVRQLLGLVPGASADEFERDLLGSCRPDAPAVPNSLRRAMFIAARTPLAIALQGRRLRRLHTDQLAWWRAEVLRPTGRDPRALLAEADRRFQWAFRVHLHSRGNLLTAMQARLNKIAIPAGGEGLAVRVSGGFGGVGEAELVDALWQVSQGTLSREEFLAGHGYHGPGEGSPVARSWREDPAPLDGLLEAYADSGRPRTREEAAGAAHRAAVAELMAALPRSKRPAARIALRGLGAQVRHLAVGKAAFVIAIDGARAAVRRIGAELVAAGRTTDPDDAFYLTYEELLGPVPDNLAEVVAFRRSRRHEHEQVELPVSFTGMPEPVPAAAPARSDTVTGAPGSAGVVEGAVRVMLDAAEDDLIEPGEILVCRLTDPGWAPVLTLAEGLVVDVGGPASHGAVVAREMGIPCVIGTGDGTRVLRTGDVVRVDGSAGTVTVLSRASR